jgi:phage-related protein
MTDRHKTVRKPLMISVEAHKKLKAIAEKNRRTLTAQLDLILDSLKA